jgi:hypothetical protein
VPITTQRSNRGQPRLNATTMRDGSFVAFCLRVTKWAWARRAQKIPDPPANDSLSGHSWAPRGHVVALIATEVQPKQRARGTLMDWLVTLAVVGVFGYLLYLGLVHDWSEHGIPDWYLAYRRWSTLHLPRWYPF